MATYALKVDMNATRTEYLADDTDVSADVTAVGGVGDLLFSTERGHDLSRVLAPPMAGAMHTTLDNQSGDFDIGTDLKPGRHARATATHSATDYEMFNGVLDHPVQAPYDDGINRYVYLTVLGNLARLVGRAVSTALYQNISTGTAINHLLDAAGVAKNLQGYLDDIGPAGGWNLASTSGDDPDTSGNANNAVITLGSGTRGATAIDDSGTLSTDFDGAATQYVADNISAINNLFFGGAVAICLINADSDGEADEGYIIDKTNYRLQVADQSGSTMRLRWWYDFSGTDGSWQTTSRIVTVGTNYLVAVFYDANSNLNNPTMWVIDLAAGTFSELTVGSGLTESASPTGTANADTANDLYIGNTSGATRTFDGKIGTIRLYPSSIGEEAAWTALMKEAAARALNAPRHLDDGGTDLAWWWLDPQSDEAFSALETLKNTEGPGAALYEDPTGAIVFKDRYARASETRSTVVQTTFNDRPGDTEPLLSLPFAYDPGLKDVVNVCEVEVRRREAQALAVVWELGEDANLGASESRTYIARQSSGDPFTAAVTPTTGAGDYTVASGSVSSVALDRTSGAQVAITITAGAGGASVTGLRLRAQSVAVVNTAVRRNTIDTSTSQEAYGRRDFRLRIRPEIDFNLAQDFCDAIVTYYQDGRPQITITVDAEQANERMVAALTREVGDRIHVTVAPDVDSDMVVEHIRHDVLAPATHRTTLGCEIAGTVAGFFLLDTSEMDSTDEMGF